MADSPLPPWAFVTALLCVTAMVTAMSLAAAWIAVRYAPRPYGRNYTGRGPGSHWRTLKRRVTSNAPSPHAAAARSARIRLARAKAPKPPTPRPELRA